MPNYQVMGPLSDEEFAALKADIAERGVLVPVVVDAEGTIIDGHHRRRAVEELRAEGVVGDVAEPPEIVRKDLKTETEKRDEAWRLNMQRRHLNRAQKRDIVAAKLKESPEWANNRIGSLLGVDGRTVSSVRFTLEAASEIPKLERLIGADGKEYPRHYTDDLEAQARYLEERKQAEIRRALLDPVTRHRSDAGIAEDLDVAESEVRAQREDLSEHGPRVRDLLGFEEREMPQPGTPEYQAERDRRRKQIEAELPEKAQKAVHALWWTWHRTDPEKAAGLSQRRFEQFVDPHAERAIREAKEARDWLNAYIRALEELNRRHPRLVK